MRKNISHILTVLTMSIVLIAQIFTSPLLVQAEEIKELPRPESSWPSDTITDPEQIRKYLDEVNGHNIGFIITDSPVLNCGVTLDETGTINNYGGCFMEATPQYIYISSNIDDQAILRNFVHHEYYHYVQHKEGRLFNRSSEDKECEAEQFSYEQGNTDPKGHAYHYAGYCEKSIFDPIVDVWEKLTS